MSGLLKQLQKNTTNQQQPALGVSVIRQSGAENGRGSGTLTEAAKASSSLQPVAAGWLEVGLAEKRRMPGIASDLLELAISWGLENRLWQLNPADFKQALAEFIAGRRVSYRQQLALESELEQLIFGCGPLADLFEDPAVYAIHIDSHDSIRVIRNGQSMQTPFSFFSAQSYQLYYRSTFARMGIELDSGQPANQGILNDSWHTKASLLSADSVAGDQPRLCLMPSRPRQVVLYDLLREQTLPAVLAAWLAEAVATKEANLLVVGPAGSGKSLMIGGLLSAVGSDQRLLVFEERPRISVASGQAEHVYWGQISRSSIGELSAAKLFDAAVERFPHRIALDRITTHLAAKYLAALESGFSGSIAGIRAGSAASALHLFAEFSAGSANGILQPMTRRVANAISLVVRMERIKGQPCLVELAEVIGVDGFEFVLKPLVSYQGVIAGVRQWSIETRASDWIERIAQNGVLLTEGPKLRFSENMESINR